LFVITKHNLNKMEIIDPKTRSIAIIVAHPDDEILWTGGIVLSHPEFKWFILCLCRASDKDRAPKFYKVLKILGADGVMGDLDDGPEQNPLKDKEVEQTILQLLPQTHFDLIISHNLTGEYTEHLRHEEISRAVIMLWQSEKISAKELWTFAYEDGEKRYLPRAIRAANLYKLLPEEIWQKKYDIITKDYGYNKNSWEAKTTPKREAFWRFKKSADALFWLTKGGKL